MRIACVQSFPIDYCIDYVNAIAPHHETLFLAKDRDTKGRETAIDHRATLMPLAWPRHRSLANIGLLRQMSDIIRSEDVDLVHFLGDDVTWLNLLPFMIGWRPVVITVHDADIHPGDTDSKNLPQFATDEFYRRGTRLIVHGEGIRRDLAERSGRPVGMIDVVPHVALHRYGDLARRHGLKSQPSSGGRRALFFGRVMAYKGLSVLLQAAVSLKRGAVPDLELVVAGRGPDLDNLRGKLSASHIRLHHGFVPDEEAAQLFLDTDLVVLPYLKASQSGILALAAAFGKPVVVTETGELGEMVRATGMGLVVPPGDSTALAEAMASILNDQDLAQQCGEASLKAGTEGIMSPDHVATAATRSYEQAIALTVRPNRHAS